MKKENVMTDYIARYQPMVSEISSQGITTASYSLSNGYGVTLIGFTSLDLFNVSLAFFPFAELPANLVNIPLPTIPDGFQQNYSITIEALDDLLDQLAALDNIRI
jgi:hypothetical protein